ncbi:DegT/DnrJ/EryC1/StrS family aminotransferase [Mucilaginibacter xinganensis]|uniref:dTDP-4-amino-4,6-dideoxygalactose transaminase n=1 Tax=Mucilaginibacter xinganensis TaxID=1234841 RepID=A0A223NXY0_9SPHI|nr:DegT/DnrJ/EryC1/StrS family aminotransferase [Mucilaginibacter xinganensis]ASU34739.1 dTDP-4-amino-4,6-dideoxygalactose transaminase [Mucilaginibacter xinganensis]
MIPVTKPFLPSEKEFKSYTKSIWERQWLTNNGPLVNTLELKLKEYLGLDHLLFVSNGTVALQLAIKALDLKGEIITTPFSFVATTSSIVWQGCKPVFVDIDPETFNIDASKIEAAITPQTSAILATHVYGNPCDIEAIQRIAGKHNLKVIYDAAHCFGTRYKNKSIFAYGDISTVSFHSTKLFHTIEGGAVITTDPDILKKLALMRNFGYSGVDTFSEQGINAKNCEFHAAMGLCNLGHIDDILKKRRYLSEQYRLRLKKLDVQFQKLENPEDFNYAYFPVLFETEELMHESKANLELAQIYSRRYFYPSLSALPYVDNVIMPVCDSIAKRIICLPLYHTLTISDLDLICRILLRSQNFGEKQMARAKQIGVLIAEQLKSKIKSAAVKTNGIL